MEILGILAIIITAITFFLFDIPTRIREWRYSIHLTPKVVSINKSNWVTTKKILIVNNNPYPIFTVKLEISEKKLGTNIDHIKIKPEPYITPTNFNPTTDLNAFIISGVSKITGKKWKRSIIYQIDAGSSINIKLTIPPPVKAEEFKLRIASFSKESNPVFNTKNATRINF